ncbi:hypothetical protein [Halopiger djelfimassiliensis]|uniref:hypothetical protein n=1 Tax=Halopiger djelfimassiliensis TaxID=1293047 RepID=UPI000677B1A7|nr:hypothetical protein [Halopiger djelfimassiliensis]
MLDDDLRGLESPDRQGASTEPAARERSEKTLPTRDRLETIDETAQALLVDVRRASGAGMLEDRRRRTAVRHLREIRAEAACVRRELLGEGSTPSDERDRDADECAERADGRTDDTSIPMLVRRGGGTTTVLGPDPGVFEREYED